MEPTEKKHPISKKYIEKLKKNSPVGKMVKFYYMETLNDYYHKQTEAGRERLITVNGPIEAVYEHTFKVDGKIYQWADYALGFVY